MTNTRFNHVWDAITDSPAESLRLQTRAELMHQIVVFTETKNWSQSEIASYCSLTQSRAEELLCGKVAKFSLDDLVSIAANLGVRVKVTLHSDSPSS